MIPILIAEFAFALTSQPAQSENTVNTAWKDPGFAKLVGVQSPNCDRRPKDVVVDTVVLHATVLPTLESTVRAFSRDSSRVSAHYTIGKDGSIVQHVSTFERAWHAGQSEDWRGKERLNDFSLGIELVNLNDGHDPYPDEQVTALRYLLASLKRRFPLQFVTSHAFVARPVGRKSDPLGFPWEKLNGLGFTLELGPTPPVPAPQPNPNRV